MRGVREEPDGHPQQIFLPERSFLEMNPPFVKVSVDVKLLIKDPVRTLLPILSEIPGWELVRLSASDSCEGP